MPTIVDGLEQPALTPADLWCGEVPQREPLGSRTQVIGGVVYDSTEPGMDFPVAPGV